MQKPKDDNLQEVVPEIASVPDDGQNMLEELKEEATPPIENPTLTERELLEKIDLYLNRMFRVGELLPWKGVTFSVAGIRDGLVGLRVHSIKEKRKNPKAEKGFYRNDNRRWYKRKAEKEQANG